MNSRGRYRLVGGVSAFLVACSSSYGALEAVDAKRIRDELKKDGRLEKIRPIYGPKEEIDLVLQLELKLESGVIGYLLKDDSGVQAFVGFSGKNAIRRESVLRFLRGEEVDGLSMVDFKFSTQEERSKNQDRNRTNSPNR